METKGRKIYSTGGHNETESSSSSTSVVRRSESSYKPSISGRTTVVSRSSSGSVPGTLSRFDMRQSTAGLPLAQFGDFSSAGVSTFKEERTHEKAELQDLNNRLANYMEKMRYLEAMNKALEKEIEKLKKGKDVDFEKIKAMYEDELKQARKVIEDLSKEKADYDVRILSVEDEIVFVRSERDQEAKDKESYKNKAEKLADQIGDYEGEVTHLRLRVAGLEDDILKLQETIKRLQAENNRLRRDLDTETVAHINEANRAQGLEEELSFTTQVYEQEIKELQELARRDTTIEMRDFWKGEMGGALKEIQAEYDSRLGQISSTLELKYNAQVNQISASVNRDGMEISIIKEDNKKLRNKLNDLNARISELIASNAALDAQNKQLSYALKEKDDELESQRIKFEGEIRKLRGEIESVMVEMKMLLDSKLSLELEITAYRKLLESEEGRFDMRRNVEALGGFASAHESGFEQIVQKSSHSSKDLSGSGMTSQKSETTGRLIINRTSRGGVTFSDITPDGKSITITNNSAGFRKRDFQMKGWTIERRFKDGSPSVEFTFSDEIELKPEESITVFARCARHKSDNPNEVNAEYIQSWGMGQADTVLRDDSGAEKASHKQTFSN